MPENIVSGLSSEITRVSLKAERWRRDMAELGKHGKGMAFGLAVMEAAIQRGRDALARGDTMAMLAAYQPLKDYSDDD